MITILGLLKSQIGKYLAVSVAVATMLLTFWTAASKAGRATEQAKAKQREIDGLNEQLEMHRDAAKFERENAALSNIAARAKAARRLS